MSSFLRPIQLGARAVLLASFLVLVFFPGLAEARRITPRLERALTLIAEHGSADEAAALRKFFQIEGYEHIPLHRSFVDASIGRESTGFLRRQIARLEELSPRRRYLAPIIADLRTARDALERTGYLNRRTDEPLPSDREVLADYRYDADRFRLHIRALTGADSVVLREADRARGRTVRLANRYMGSPENQLAETALFLKQYYEGLGLTVRLEPVPWRGRVYHNVIVTIPGERRETIMLGAHYDTAIDQRAPTDSGRVSPGADDNGSGTAALMEAALALRGRRFQKTVQLVHFVGEEQPGVLRGSRTHVARLGRADRIQAAFILDSIGFNRNGGSRMFLHTDRNERSLFLASEIARASTRLGTGLSVAGRIPSDGHLIGVHDTDSSAFSRRGVPTVFVAEDFHWRRGIHDSRDRVGQLDFTYAGRILASTLEAAARVAQPIEAEPAIARTELPADGPFGRYRTRAGRDGRPPPVRDELMDRQGTVRPGYRGVVRAMANTSARTVQAAARGMNQDARDATEFRALPRVIEPAEWTHIEQGLGQIERAMQAALNDLYSGNSRLLREGILTREDLGLAEGYDDWYVGAYERNTRFNFILRPDLVRDQQGRLTVLELNMGYVGGFGDLVRNRRLLQGNNPRVFDHTRVEPVDAFPRQLFDQLRSLSRRPNPKIVFTTVGAQRSSGDREDIEFARELERHGVEYVTATTQKQLQTIRGQVYLVSPNGERERVDVVYSRTGWVPAEMELAHVNGGVAVFPTPGSSVFEAKNLYPKIARIIRTMLREEPILRFLETRQFAGRGNRVDARFLERVMQNPSQWVLKKTGGAQGIGIVVGRDATAAELRDARARILRDPSAWSAQEYVEPTTLNGERVDLAPFLVTANGERIVPRSAMVRTARGRAKFGDNPRFLDTWVIASGQPRDYLKRGPSLGRARQPSATTTRRRSLDAEARTRIARAPRTATTRTATAQPRVRPR